MQANNAPSKSAVPFANSGTKNTIPVASQIGVTPGAASFTDGFPPLTMTPLAAGGVPPYGADFNGILNFLSSAVRWDQAGARYPFDATFVAAIGGYPKGAVLSAATGNGAWLCLVDNNSANPDTGGANWASLGEGIASTSQAQAMSNDSVLLTPKKLASAFQGGNQSWISGGYQRLPGGFKICAGNGLTPPDGSLVIAFPDAFTLAPAVTLAAVDAGTLANITLTGPPTATGFPVRSAFTSNGAATSINFYWMAMGI